VQIWNRLAYASHLRSAEADGEDEDRIGGSLSREDLGRSCRDTLMCERAVLFGHTKVRDPRSPIQVN
jgi:hypothetical protein